MLPNRSYAIHWKPKYHGKYDWNSNFQYRRHGQVKSELLEPMYTANLRHPKKHQPISEAAFVQIVVQTFIAFSINEQLIVEVIGIFFYFMKFNIEKYNLKREKKEKQRMSYKIIYIIS